MKHTAYSSAWLDWIAGFMSLACAIHCLITPLLLIALPVLASTFFVHENFHAWMLLLVLPTTSLAIFLGCRKHKDRMVVVLGVIGLSLLASAGIYESFALSGATAETTAHCSQCAGESDTSGLNALLLINVFGGMLMISAHVRNFKLCRRHQCRSSSAGT